MKPNPNFISNFSNKVTESVNLAKGRYDDQNMHNHFLNYAASNNDGYQASDKIEFVIPGVKFYATEPDQSEISNSDYLTREKERNAEEKMLNELRSEFREIQDKIHTNNYGGKSRNNSDYISNSSDGGNNRELDDESSSSVAGKGKNKYMRVWQMEKRQYECVLINCRNKKEELLHAEMEYLKEIHELRAIAISKPQNLKTNSELKHLQKQLKQQTQNNAQLVFDNQKLREYLGFQKDRYLNCEIEKRKLEMENEILQKQRDQLVMRYEKQAQHYNVVNQVVKNIHKKYEDDIQIKDTRYVLLLSQFQKLKTKYADTQQQITKPNHNQMLQLFQELLQHNQNNQNQHLTQIIAKFGQSLNASDNQQQIQILLSQIKKLKVEIETLRNNGDGIDFESMRKMYEVEIAALKDTITILNRKSKTPQTNGFGVPSNNQEILSYQGKITELQSRIYDNAHNNSEAKLQALEEQLRAERQQRYSAEFQVSKLQKQLQFRLNILNKQRQSELRFKQSEVDKANLNIQYWRDEFNNMRRFYDQKIAQKNSIIEHSFNNVEISLFQQKAAAY